MTEQQDTDAVTTYLAAEADYTDAVTTFLAAGTVYTTALADVDVAATVSPTLSCAKVNVIAQLLDKAGHREDAERWIDAHCTTNDADELKAHANFYLGGPSWH